MRTVYYAADSRASVRHDGLISRRTFSFATYDNPQRMGFGCLRALNEEWLAPGKGIPLHAHEDMEIMSIPVTGTLRHQDSRGTSHVIPPGDMHVLSAGLGVTHWESNHADDETAHYLQLWIEPRSRGTPTRYRQRAIDPTGMIDRFFLAAAPPSRLAPLSLDQDAYVSVAKLATGKTLTYGKQQAANGVYVFLIDGSAMVATQELTGGDGLSVLEFDTLDVVARAPSRILCIEVPTTA